MAEVNGPNLLGFCVSGTVSLVFIIYHTYRVDSCRCLLLSRKEWFRSLLTWMLISSNICLIVWAGAWTYCKYMLGWVKLGPAGARPFPSAFFPSPYDHYNAPLTVLLGVCYTLQASLNAEEGLYWYHLMRAVRRPQAAVPFLKSGLFYAWIILSVVVAAIQLSVPWIGHDGNLLLQLSKELLAGGALELVVLCASTIVVYKFPRFLSDVQSSGAGPEVRARLHFYHEMNRLRTLFRFFFTFPLLILGVDGLTAETKINLMPLLTDILAFTTVASLSVVMMISIILYLPRASSTSPHHRVMVGQMPATTRQATQLISMLREAGQWDGVDDDLTGHNAPFADAGGETRVGSWNSGAEEKWTGRDQPQIPAILQDFTPPIVVSTAAQPQRAVEIRIDVQREVHHD